MKMTFSAALMVATLFAFPASALTLEQAQAELAGMHCDGSKCVSFQETSTTTDLPDIVTTGVSHPRVFPNAVNKLPAGGSYAGKYEWARDGEWQSIRTTSRGFVNVIDGGTETTFECTRTKKVLTFHPNSSRALSWSIETTVASLPGHC